MAEPKRFYFDANSVIAILERSEPLNAHQRAFLLGIADGRLFCCASELTLTECIVKPLRVGNITLANEYARFLDTQLSAPLMQLDRRVLLLAAEIRAGSGTKLPDAIHVACASVSKCTIMLSADKALPLPSGMARCSFEDINSGHLGE